MSLSTDLLTERQQQQRHIMESFPPTTTSCTNKCVCELKIPSKGMRQTYYDDHHSNGNHRNPNSIPNQDANDIGSEHRRIGEIQQINKICKGQASQSCLPRILLFSLNSYGWISLLHAFGSRRSDIRTIATNSSSYPLLRNLSRRQIHNMCGRMDIILGMPNGKFLNAIYPGHAKGP